MLLEETSELSFELAIGGRSGRSSRDVPSEVAKKCVGADLSIIPATVLSAAARMIHGLGPDSPRPNAETSLPCHEAGWSALGGRTVRSWWPDDPHVCRDDSVRQQHLDLAPRRDPVEEERS
jgi:hypothetical protein